jgi:hypothetical protein
MTRVQSRLQFELKGKRSSRAVVDLRYMTRSTGLAGEGVVGRSSRVAPERSVHSWNVRSIR